MAHICSFLNNTRYVCKVPSYILIRKKRIVDEPYNKQRLGFYKVSLNNDICRPCMALSDKRAHIMLNTFLMTLHKKSYALLQKTCSLTLKNFAQNVAVFGQCAKNDISSNSGMGLLCHLNATFIG